MAQVSPDRLIKEAQLNINKVAEFAYIQKAAEEIGVKVYLFGGSAAAYAHYVRWYIELQEGAQNHQPERFDFDYTNIYRGNQDLDLVVDGTKGQAQSFQRLLRSKYAHIVGDKNDWEVRLLREQIGDKLPLLDNPDFKNQHTDTNSTGMIDLTAKEEDPIFRDLLDWDNVNSRFLEDVSQAKITYLFNEKHKTTLRFQQGKNPPLFSAIRYLAKLTQYEVKGSEKDLETIKKIIENTSTSEFNSYVRIKLEEFAKKALLNSPNSEYAWDLLENTGVRRKLIEMDGNQTHRINSLSWWLSKEPLRSKDLGRTGDRAKDIFGSEEIIVSHETKSFQAYENITRSSRGEANAFISRNEVNGEYAVYGNGFYTRIGMNGARGTGLTIRFKLHPEARLDSDFTMSGDYIVVTNKKALELIQENINIDFKSFLKLILKNQVSESDKGLLEKLVRKFQRVPNESPEFLEGYNYIKSFFDLGSDLPEEFRFDFPDARTLTYKDLMHLISKDLPAHNKKIKNSLLTEQKKWLNRPESLEKALSMKSLAPLVISGVLSDLFWLDHSEFIIKVIEMKEHSHLLAQHIFSQKEWAKYPELFLKLIQMDSPLSTKTAYALSFPHWSKHPHLLEAAMKQKESTSSLIVEVFPKKHWKGSLHLLESIIKKSSLKEDRLIVSNILSMKHLADFPNILSLLIEKETVAEEIAKNVFSKPEWTKHPKLLKTFIEKNSPGYSVSKEIIPEDLWENDPKLLDEYADSVLVDRALAKSTFSQPHWQGHPELLLSLIYKNTVSDEIVRHALVHEHWSKYPELAIELLKTTSQAHVRSNFIHYVLNKPYWQKYPEIFDLVIEYDIDDSLILLNTMGLEDISEQKKLLFKIFKKENNKTARTFSHVFLIDFWNSHFDLVQGFLTSYNDEDALTLFMDNVIKKLDLAEIQMKTIFEILLQKNSPTIKNLLLDSSFNKGYSHQGLLDDTFSGKTLDEHTLINISHNEWFKDDSQLMFKLLSNHEHHYTLVENVLVFSPWTNNEKVAEYLIENGSRSTILALINNVFNNSGWMQNSKLILKLINIGQHDITKATVQLLFERNLKIDDEIIDAILEKDYGSWELLRNTTQYSKPKEKALISYNLASRGLYFDKIIEDILTTDEMASYPEIALKILELIQKPPSFFDLFYPLLPRNEIRIYNFMVDKLLTQKQWKKNPEVLVELIKIGKVHNKLMALISSDPDWEDHPVLKAYTGTETVDLHDIRLRLLKVDFNEWFKGYKSSQSKMSCTEVLSF